MLFPETQRIIYNKNPLDQVICQLRFPTILRIDNQSPFEFQESIREHYPLYNEDSQDNLDIPADQLDQIPQTIISKLLTRAPSKKVQYRFSSEDENWTISLTNNFLALTAKKYNRWENFRDHLEIPLLAFEKFYAPPFYSRIGLRYVNVIKKSSLGLENSNWFDLISPAILGLLSSSIIDEKTIKNSFTTDEIHLPDSQDIIKLNHGLAITTDDEEIVYVIDNDFFTQKRTEVTDAYAKLDTFNHRGGSLFRFCITDFLHTAMEPANI